MPDQSNFDHAKAHRHFSTNAFNTAWDLMEKTDRTEEENMEMFCRAAASLWHWNQRPDICDQSRSVGYWQLSRVFALLSEPAMARRCGELSLKYSDAAPPFYAAYAHEALARAAAIGGDSAGAKRHVAAAEKLVDRIEEDGSREMLLADLKSIRG